MRKIEKGAAMAIAVNTLAVAIAKADGNAHPHRQLCDALHEVVSLIYQTIAVETSRMRVVMTTEQEMNKMVGSLGGDSIASFDPDPIDVENTMGWLNLSDGEWDHLLGDTQDKLIEAYKKAAANAGELADRLPKAATKLDKIDTFVKAFDQWSYQYQVAANCSTEDLPVHRDILATRMKTLLAARAALKD